MCLILKDNLHFILCSQAEAEYTQWQDRYQAQKAAQDAFDTLYEEVEAKVLQGFKLCCSLAAEQQNGGGKGLECGLAELLEVSCKCVLRHGMKS